MVSTRYKQCNNYLPHDLGGSICRGLDQPSSCPAYGPNLASCTGADEVLGRFQSTAVVPVGKVLN